MTVVRQATVAMLALIVGSAFADDEKKDTEKLRGTWIVKDLIMDGKQAPAEFLGKMKMVFDGDRMKLSGPEGIGERKYTIRLDPSKKPKSIDTIPQDGPYKGKRGEGIYELEGDMLKLCLPNTNAAERPKEFEAAKGSKRGMFVLKRAQP